MEKFEALDRQFTAQMGCWGAMEQKTGISPRAAPRLHDALATYCAGRALV
jgi:hypothetical protein